MPSFEPGSVAETAIESKDKSWVTPSRSTVTVMRLPAGTVRMSVKGVEARVMSWRVPSGVVIANRISPSWTMPSALEPSVVPAIVTVAGTSQPRYSRAATWEVVCELRIMVDCASLTLSWVVPAG